MSYTIIYKLSDFHGNGAIQLPDPHRKVAILIIILTKGYRNGRDIC